MRLLSSVPMPEHRSADRSSICAHAWQSLGTCPVALLGDGGRSVGARCNVCCRMRHRQLGGQGQHCGRQSSCAVSDRRRWTGWRSPRSRRLILLVRIFPLRATGGRGSPRRGLYQDARTVSFGELGSECKPCGVAINGKSRFLNVRLGVSPRQDASEEAVRSTSS